MCVGNGFDLQAQRSNIDGFVEQYVDGRCDIGIIVGNGSERQLFIESRFDLSRSFGETEPRVDDHTAGCGGIERDRRGNFVIAAMHACGSQPSSRDPFDGFEHMFIRFDGVIDPALCGDAEPFLVVIDEDGDCLVVDQKLSDDVAQFARSENGYMGAFGDVEKIDDGFAGCHDPCKQRLGIGNARREGGEVFLFGYDEIAHISFGVHAGDLHIPAGIGIARKATFAFAAGNGIVDKHAGIFFDFHAGGAGFTDDADGKSAGNKRVFRLRVACKSAKLRAGEQKLRDFDLGLRVAREIVGPFFRRQDFGRKNFPDLHSTPFHSRKKSVQFRVKYYNAKRSNLQANRTEKKQKGQIGPRKGEKGGKGRVKRAAERKRDEKSGGLQGGRKKKKFFSESGMN